VTATQADVPTEWGICDALVHLREWGTDVVHRLPPPEGNRGWTIGAAAGAWLQLRDPSGRVSRQHAQLTYANGWWTISDLQSKNGICQDGARQVSFPLAPGVEIRIGGIVLIAESPRLGVLRELLARLLGWSDGRRPDVDLALRAVRMAATRRQSLLLCGDGDIVSIAQLLHRHTHGDARPFIVCDPRRRSTPSSARAAANYAGGMAALAAAAGGTLCIWQRRQLDDFAQVFAAIREPASRAQLVICTHALHHGVVGTPVILPPLTERASELDRIIDAYAVDAVAELDAVFTQEDRIWVKQNESATLPEIEKAVRRLAALRSARGDLASAANQLGMSYSALFEWVARRTLPEIDGNR
jgi:hypothetical protein